MNAHLTLAGMDEGQAGFVRVTSVHYEKQRSDLKPHHTFRNWTNLYKVPLVCVIEIAIFALYLLFTNFHQRTSIAFTLDISEAIKSYFLQEIELPEAPKGLQVGVGQIFFKDDLKSFINISTYHFFAFATNFPLAYPFLTARNGILQIDEEAPIFFSKTNHSLIADICEEHFAHFTDISLEMTYHIQVTGISQDERMSLTITINFHHDLNTGSIFMDISHTRFQEKSEMNAESFLDNVGFSLPVFIAFLNLCAVIILLITIYDLYNYCQTKAIDTGQRPTTVFMKKLDKWDVFALFTHAFSIIATIYYTQVGQDIEDKVPPILYMLSVATLCHSIVMIRYLQLKASTMLIINVFYRSAIKILQFLIGSLPLFVAYLILGMCLFGHLSEGFATGIHSSSYLFCVMHGDSILFFFNSVIRQNDISPVLGFLYSASWIALSLLVMFNITISIVQEVLASETEKMEKQEENPESQPLNLLAGDLSMISTKKNF